MYQENKYNYDDSNNITDHCDICGANSFYQTGMPEQDVCLCDYCSNKIVMLDDGIIKDSIIKFAMGNVF